MKEQQLTRALGWFSIGLGLAQILAPRQARNATGIHYRQSIMPALGAREIISGLGILTRNRPSAWLWSRVAGDVMDLAILAGALTSPRANRRKLALATGAVAGVTALDVYCSIKTAHPNGHSAKSPSERGQKLVETITINRPAADLYQFWRKFENLPQIMPHLRSVTALDNKRSHWVAVGPAGTSVEWDAEIVQEEENALIAWRSLPGSTVENHGSVTFEPATGGRGTVLRVEIQYRPPGGKAGATVAKLLGQSPEQQIPADLRRFRQLMETGEITTTEGQPSGRSKSTSTRFDKVLPQLAES